MSKTSKKENLYYCNHQGFAGSSISFLSGKKIQKEALFNSDKIIGIIFD
jgi:hypothetical protein